MSWLDNVLDGIDKWNKGQTNPTTSVNRTNPSPPKLSHKTTTKPASRHVAKKMKIDDVMGAGLRLKKWGCSFYYSTKVQKITQTDEGVTYHQVEEEPTTEQIELELGDEPIITTAAQCEQAIKELYGHKAIAVDCEGVNLGRTGKLCLVQIGTPSKTYLFDIIEGGSALFQFGLRKLLEDATIIKVMHDCSDALFHEHQVTLKNVYDTQIGYAIVERQQTGTTPLPVGLNTLLKRYGLGAVNEAKDVMKEQMQLDPEFWAKRPMSEIALLYARKDVAHLCLVQRQIDAVLSKMSRSNLCKYSDLYLSQYRDSETPKVRTSEKDPKERFVPQYGIKLWDTDTALSLERAASRKAR